MPLIADLNYCRFPIIREFNSSSNTHVFIASIFVFRGKWGESEPWFSDQWANPQHAPSNLRAYVRDPPEGTEKSGGQKPTLWLYSFRHDLQASNSFHALREVSYECYILTAYKKAFYKFVIFDVIFRFCFWRFDAVSRQFVAPDGDDRNVIFTNAEEEVFIPECDLVLEMESPAGTSQETSGGTNSASSR